MQLHADIMKSLRNAWTTLVTIWSRLSWPYRGLVLLVPTTLAIYVIQTWNIVHTSPTSIGPAHNDVPVEILKFMTYPPSELALTANFRGRLGNNLFNYATLLGLAKRQGRVPVLVPNEEIMSQNGREFLYGFNLYHARRSNTVTRWLSIAETEYGRLQERFLHLPPTDVMIDGYFCAWTYFNNAIQEIREDLTFSDEIQKETDRLLRPVYEKYPGHVQVGVHVRRGDFIESQKVRYGYTAAPVSYFQKAFDHMQSRLSDRKLVFVVATDDLRWCEDNLIRTGYNNIHFLGSASAIVHMSALSRSEHVVMSTGSYGWWGSWLAGGWGSEKEGSNTTVIYYSGFPIPGSRLTEGFIKEEYYPPHWIPLP